MKIPNSVNIFGTKYKIRFVDTDLFAGLCDPAKKTIFINKNQTKENIDITFWHEVFHSVQFTLGMNNAISREMMEMIAENYAQVVVQCLKK
jgi:hypothetical protein